MPLLFTTTTSAAREAAAVAVEAIATPTSAAASAGASLIPSPTMMTPPPPPPLPPLLLLLPGCRAVLLLLLPAATAKVAALPWLLSCCTRSSFCSGLQQQCIKAGQQIRLLSRHPEQPRGRHELHDLQQRPTTGSHWQQGGAPERRLHIGDAQPAGHALRAGFIVTSQHGDALAVRL